MEGHRDTFGNQEQKEAHLKFYPTDKELYNC
jgi:hypothetical protein